MFRRSLVTKGIEALRLRGKVREVETSRYPTSRDDLEPSTEIESTGLEMFFADGEWSLAYGSVKGDKAGAENAEGIDLESFFHPKCGFQVPACIGCPAPKDKVINMTPLEFDREKFCDVIRTASPNASAARSIKTSSHAGE